MIRPASICVFTISDGYVFIVLTEEALFTKELYEHCIILSSLVSDDSCCPYLDECTTLGLLDALGLRMILKAVEKFSILIFFFGKAILIFLLPL